MDINNYSYIVVLFLAAPVGAAVPASSSSSSSSSSVSSFACSKLFDELSKKAGVDLVKRVGVIYRFDVSSDDGKSSQSWLVDLKTGSGKISTCNSDNKADTIIILSDSNLVALLGGKLNAQKAFMEGKIKLKGNMMLAQKLQAITSGSKL